MKDTAPTHHLTHWHASKQAQHRNKQYKWHSPKTHKKNSHKNIINIKIMGIERKANISTNNSIKWGTAPTHHVTHRLASKLTHHGSKQYKKNNHQNHEKASRNKCVFRATLNDANEGDLWRSSGRLFQTRGAWLEKERSPPVFRPMQGSTRAFLELERRLLHGLWIFRQSDR